MSIHVALRHVTQYRYDKPVELSPQLVRLRPAPHCRTPILSYSQRIAPSSHFLNWQQDPQSNYVARLTFPEKVEEFRVEVDLVVEMAVYNPFDFFLEPSAEHFPFCYEASELRDLLPFLHAKPLTPRLAHYLKGVDRRRRRTIDFLVDVNRQLQHDISYVIRLDPGVQEVERTLELASGSCRDTTWLLAQLFRHLGLAARFVSGYLIQLAPDVKALEGPTGAGRDFTDLHAWCEVYLPGAGWIGLDPTSGLLAGEGHIPLACTPEPTSAAPVSGGVERCKVEFFHEMSVQRIAESPRVTKPYTDAQWKTILACGRAVDEDFAAGDVRLTMGGEPTFVSTTDRDADEWNTAALGPTKRARAADLLLRLKRRYGANGFVHQGQGKWYPGEQLPRWTLGCYWRADGEPAWMDASLFADDQHPDGHGAGDAERFITALAAQLDVTAGHMQAGYEDVWYYLWRERKLPVNVDPFDARLDDELERDRLRHVFTQGLDAIVGYALPIRRVGARDGRWATGPWSLRDARLYLVPGDSPMGLRLPLDSLPWSAPGDLLTIDELDPFAPRAPLPVEGVARRPSDPQSAAGPRPGFHGVPDPAVQSRVGSGDRRPADDVTGHPPSRGESAAGVVRSALCVEPRGGVLYIFMPPVQAIEDYLDLVAAIEATSRALGMRVLLEGYPPPSDPRLAHFLVTPDPGVIEVNVQPARNWNQLVDQTTALYEDARHAGLAPEKFMLDGRHTGTGGGNHFVLGGSSATDSPFLRRPDLLRSLITYWHNHPSLSYLFSGLFLGPTSQAPRIDEGRHDSLYEIEIAFSRFAPPGSATPPWFVDRALRHLLVDVTGNTHRAEFCIDKLYSPDLSSGRRGLLELRAFEMPPDARMSVVQQLLLRALIARFWREPYTAGLTRWGTELHDRFMLPYFVALDFDDVIEELRRAGYQLSSEWFAPHLEFRFPLAGELSARAIHLTLRQALEPWHVLGEEGSAGGTTRFVDSSLERLQLLVTGLTGDRFVITCNGRPLPLQPTGRNGEFVAGVRYRAWHPPSALHPTIPVHTPLTFDIVDNWMEQSVAGCQYHVMHPGGRNYDQFPVNSYEAESRRLARFTRLAHTPGRVRAGRPERSLEFPYTLDLRT
ncbi:MAG: IMP dehydrogenase [Acidobacteria bacterium 13_1_20CM_2_65_9]|nr:MAG: IMP dehydrogenase [Acidobacteria bacterium 13_1_20CM_2_65_9]